MDGESIVYVIIAIVYFLVSVLNSRKKAKAKKLAKKKSKSVPQQRTLTPEHDTKLPPEVNYPQQQEIPKETPQEVTLEDMLEDIFGNKTHPAPQQMEEVFPRMDFLEVERKRKEDEQKRQEETERYETLKRQRELDHERKRVARNRRQASVVARRQARREMPKTHKKLFGSVNLREAIIASIILDRPYQ